jgi:competence protein ComEA
MQLKELIKAFLTYGKRDRLAVITVVLLIALIYAWPYLFSKKNEHFPIKASSVLVKAIDSMEVKQKSNGYIKKSQGTDDDNKYYPSPARTLASAELFAFDPNTLPVEGWQKLGLSEKTSHTIEKYRSKGGIFHKADDLKKIWGLPEGFYERVKDYVVIASTPNDYPKTEFQKTVYTKSEKKVVVDINQADTSVFIALPGIGSKLAARIVNFRDKLGGFYSIEQIGETYGLPDSTFQIIKPSLRMTGSVTKLNVNMATKDELKMHPYIKWNLANAIVEYRNQHGPFNNLEELRKIAIIDESTFEKIVHYLSL